MEQSNYEEKLKVKQPKDVPEFVLEKGSAKKESVKTRKRMVRQSIKYVKEKNTPTNLESIYHVLE